MSEYFRTAFSSVCFLRSGNGVVHTIKVTLRRDRGSTGSAGVHHPGIFQTTQPGRPSVSIGAMTNGDGRDIIIIDI